MMIADLLIRGAAIGTLAACGMLFASGAPAERGRWSVPCAGIVFAAYLIVSAPGSDAVSGPVATVLIRIALLGPLALTWVLLDLLTDPPALRWPWLLAAGMTVPLGWAGSFVSWMSDLRGIAVLIVYSGLFLLVLRGRRDDLVPSRRAFRKGLLVLASVTAIAVSGVELFGIDNRAGPVLFLLQACTIWGLACGFFVWSARLAPDLVGQDTRPPPRPAVQPGLSERVQQAMRDRAWQTEGLTIGDLATQLGTPEHRLRQAINRDLGQRNFASFVNAYRIEEAKRLLADPGEEGRTILDIAYSVGFASLGPFNRAFRADTGTSPRAYRADSRKRAPIPEFKR